MAQLELDGGENGIMEMILAYNPRDGDEKVEKCCNTTVAQIIGVVESIYCVSLYMIFIMCVICVRTAIASVLTFILSSEMLIWMNLVLNVAETLAVSYCMLHRYAKWFHMSMREFISRLGLDRFHLSPHAIYVILYNIVAFSVFVACQWYFDRWYYSLSNVVSVETGAFDLERILALVFIAPLQEELIFRAIIFHILYNRYMSVRFSARVSSVLFGLAHLANAFSSKFSTIYVVLQTLLSIEIGYYYSLRFVTTGCLWECIALHTINNAVSCFVPAESLLDLSDPCISLPLFHAVLFFALLISRSNVN